jgi:hypothetical protein
MKFHLFHFLLLYLYRCCQVCLSIPWPESCVILQDRNEGLTVILIGLMYCLLECFSTTPWWWLLRASHQSPSGVRYVNVTRIREASTTYPKMFLVKPIYPAKTEDRFPEIPKGRPTLPVILEVGGKPARYRTVIQKKCRGNQPGYYRNIIILTRTSRTNCCIFNLVGRHKTAPLSDLC